jgi:RimJ/RimL family protein N-acetyltransferase
MLRYAFEAMDCIRVQFHADVLNARSQAAIRRLGAKEEGIVRYERIMPNGRKRDSLRFSIIETEWPAVRGGLEARLRALGIEPVFGVI